MLGVTVFVLVFLSCALTIGPLLLILYSIRRNNQQDKRNSDAELVQQTLSSIDLDAYGFKMEFNPEKTQLALIPLSPPELEDKFTIECKDENAYKKLNPSFGQHFKWDELPTEIEDSLKSAGSQLTPFYDFMIVWAKEIKQVVIKKHRARIDFRNKGAVPVDKLSNLVHNAAAGFYAFYTAISTPASSDSSEDFTYPQPWFSSFRKEFARKSFYLNLGLIILMICSGVFAWHMQGIVKDRLSMSWPSVEGDILTSKVNHTVTTRGRGKDRTTTESYLAEFKYRYEVGMPYENDRYSFFLTDINGEEDARKASNEFPEGTKAQVYYNPADPQDSVLKRHGDTIGYGHLLQWLLLYLLPILPFWYYRRLNTVIRNARERLSKDN